MLKDLRAKCALGLVATCIICLAAYGNKLEQNLLVIGKFHGDEVEIQTKCDWLGLFPIKNKGFELKKTEVRITKCFDVLIDHNERGKQTGKAVSVPYGEPLFLVRDIHELKAGPVYTAFINQNYDTREGQLRPGQVLTLRIKNQIAQLVVTGHEVK